VKIAAVIPARYASTRFEGKPLAKISGKPMIQHVYENVKRCELLDVLVVATDDRRIFDAVNQFGGKAMMTSSEHPTGTDRVAEVARSLQSDIIVNVQGDEPLVKPEMVEQVIAPLIDDKNIQVSNLITQILELSDYADTAVVKAVQDIKGFLLYLTRAAIPYPKTAQNFRVYKQIGLYAFRKDFLQTFVQMDQTPLELIEGIEFLRLLENGFKVKAVLTDYNPKSVDTLSDLIEVEKILARKSEKTAH